MKDEKKRTSLIAFSLSHPVVQQTIRVCFCCFVFLFAGCQQQTQIQLNPNQLKIEVVQDGFVQLTLAELQSAGLAVEQIDPDNLYLSSIETLALSTVEAPALSTVEMPALSTVEAPVSYTTTNDTLTFYGQAPTNRYTPTHVYLLETGKRGVVEETAVSPTSHHFEQNQLYESRARTQTNEAVWFWHKLQPNNSTSIDFDLPAFTNASNALTISLYGLSSNPDIAPDHNLTIRLNDHDLTTLQWDGAANHTATLAIPPNTLHEGTNRIQFDNPTAAIDVILLDWFEISGKPAAPTITYQPPAGLSLMRQTAWLNAISGAEFVIVTTDDLQTAVSPLKTHRESQGVQTAIVTVENLYDTFAHGHATPEAIQTFLQYAAANWTPSPRYVLLVGDATTDHYSYVNKLPAQHVPSFIVPVTFGGETSSDAPLADLDGNGRSHLAIGRWPVSSPQDVAHLIKHTIAYETPTNLTEATVIIDPSEPSFAQMAARLEENGRFTPLTPTPLQLDPTSWLTTYIGHGSLTQWGQSGILQQDQLPSRLPPIILQFTCLTGLFAHPTQPALAETMLLQPNSPVALVAATSLTLSQHQEPFAKSLLQALENPTNTRIGDAFLQAQQSLATQNNPNYQDILTTFHLLGDPTAPIQRPASVQKQYTNANDS